MRFAFVLSLFFTSLALADDAAMARFDAIMADPAKREQAYAAGHERIVLCRNCHGDDGNSRRDYIPNLAAQAPGYLFTAFERYASGQRTDFVMNQAARMLSLDERVNIAVYYSQQQVLPRQGAVDDALRARGEALFGQVCVACHGPQGLGQQGVPRIAGQPATYLQRTLEAYRDKDPRRAGSTMLAVASQLQAGNIEALAAYLQQLHP
ncbi:c-type cytochrome [Pseudomonas citronellolis]|uniref:c-type cytochrome n=1 Tax=Pseudomonas citronellolis TaxID=53408 RepID=UPI0021BFC7AA|nr:c-type cytochrome [Pseudomonas citronellolis]UXJ52462.1 c-type cytochrome [Pseudomonas citronellolis]